MARIRTIKPQHVTDKALVEISLNAHLLWILSWCFSDDEGVFENDPLLIRSNLFPRRTDIRTEQIIQWLDQLATARFIIPFEHNGESYYIHRTFKTHQRIDKPQDSKIPAKVIEKALKNHAVIENSKIDIGTIQEPSGLYSNGKESKVIGEYGKTKVLPPAPLPILYKDIKKEKREIFEFIKKNLPTDIEPYKDLWNIFAEENKLPKVSKVNSTRRKKFSVRIKESGFDFLEILRKAKASQFVLTGKWFGFDWLIENETNYLKLVEGNYEKSFVAPQKNVEPVKPKTQLSKLQKDVNYLFERFIEGENSVVNITVEHWDFLIGTDNIFWHNDDETIASLMLQAKEFIALNTLTESKENMISFSKKFGVLKFFAQLRSNGKEVVFS